MLVVDEQQFVARPGIGEAYATGIAGGPLVCNPAYGPLCREFLSETHRGSSKWRKPDVRTEPCSILSDSCGLFRAEEAVAGDRGLPADRAIPQTRRGANPFSRR